MSAYRIYEGHPHFLTTTVVDWIDLFTRKEYCLTLIEALDYCRLNKGLIIHAYVIMPSHLHLILSAKDPARLSDILRDFKQFTSRRIIQQIKGKKESRRTWLLERFAKAASNISKIRHYQLWQAGNHPKVLFSPSFYLQKLRYIHQNPVKAMIVSQAEHYVFSSAIDYAGGKGLLPVNTLYCF